MNTSKSLSPLFFFIFFFILLCFIKLSSSLHICKPASCNENEPLIRFPFYIKHQHHDRCGYPGFEISCNDQSQTIISLPNSGDFLVSRIDYVSQEIYLNDPTYCLPKKIVNFNINSTPFTNPPGKHYTFFNCSSDDSMGFLTNRVVPLPCLQNNNYIFLATVFELAPDELPASCVEIMNVTVPLKLSLEQYWSSTVLSEDIGLIWKEPYCQACEAERLYCGFSAHTGLGLGCFRPTKTGFSSIAKYAIGFGVGLPLLACLIGTGYFLYNKIKNLALRNNTSSHLAISSTAGGTVGGGLDSPTINSYPKTILGQNRCIPGISDLTTCPICLCEYQVNETLRNIPECNHYFHEICIDQWLKINSSCPVCRNTLQRMSAPQDHAAL